MVAVVQFLECLAGFGDTAKLTEATLSFGGFVMRPDC